MTRTPRETKPPPPEGSLSRDTATEASVFVDTTDSKAARGPAPAVATRIWPAPSTTENALAEPYLVHRPPESAMPQSPVTDRPNASATPSPVTGGSVTTTLFVTSSVAPSSSVTSSFTVRLPDDAYE